MSNEQCVTGDCHRYDCLACKGFKLRGICSHVVAINHLMKLIDVHAMLGVLGDVPKKNRGGFIKGVRPALTREDAAEARRRALAQPDSSDEEAESELLQEVSPHPRPTHTAPPSLLTKEPSAGEG